MSRRSGCAPAVLWKALTEGRASWWPEMAFTAQAGASLRETWEEDGVSREAVGQVLIVDPPFRLTFRWTQPEWPNGYATVAISLAAAGAGSIVTVVETDLAHACGDLALLDAHEQGWGFHLERLVQAAELSEAGDPFEYKLHFYKL